MCWYVGSAAGDCQPRAYIQRQLDHTDFLDGGISTQAFGKGIDAVDCVAVVAAEIADFAGEQATLLAAAARAGADLADLEAIAARTKQESDVEARYQCAVEYYAVLARATGNRIFGIFVDSLSAILHEFVQGPDYEMLQQSLIESRFKLVRHLRANDSDAAVAEMRKHLERVHRHVRKNSKAARG